MIVSTADPFHHGIGYGDPTEDITRRYGQAWDGTAAPWQGEAATTGKCKPKRGKGKRGRCR